MAKKPVGNCAWPILLAVIGGIAGLLLGAAGGGLHLYLFWRSGGEAAGTETALVPLYALPGAVLGAIAGLVAGVWLGGRRP
jgi:hypothetical protein